MREREEYFVADDCNCVCGRERGQTEEREGTESRGRGGDIERKCREREMWKESEIERE